MRSHHAVKSALLFATLHECQNPKAALGIKLREEPGARLTHERFTSDFVELNNGECVVGFCVHVFFSFDRLSFDEWHRRKLQLSQLALEHCCLTRTTKPQFI